MIKMFRITFRPHIQSCCQGGYPEGRASNLTEEMMTEMEYIHLVRR